MWRIQGELHLSPSVLSLFNIFGCCIMRSFSTMLCTWKFYLGLVYDGLVSGVGTVGRIIH